MVPLSATSYFEISQLSYPYIGGIDRGHRGVKYGPNEEDREIDHLKAINDTLGHARENEALLQLAARLLSCACGTDLVSRGGFQNLGHESSVLDLRR